MAAQARAAWGMSPADVSKATGGVVSIADLRLLEAGRLSLTEEQATALFSVLAIATEDLAPVRVRLEIDTTQGRLVAGGSVARMLPDATEHEILTRYLCLIYALRRTRPGTFVVPRADDLEVLGEAVGRPPEEVRLRLEHLMRHRRDDLRVGVRSLIGRAALPGLGLLVGVTSLGALLLVEAQPLGAAPGGSLADHQGSVSAPMPGGPSGSFGGSIELGMPMTVERPATRAAATPEHEGVVIALRPHQSTGPAELV
jgi:hypothetical protein